ncbi:hypothetical protein Zmor_017290 [Zophobas morio]|uniref:PPPDE domain-containing protein n=1 Tax=Zophobas morio TaxID=2755281 RepID=A0AA38IC05_9CUCU|nr:hypothetical protein Zmor_017290 [Zophobas morio]
MGAYPVELYIYELSPESQIWCRDQFLQVLSAEEELLHTSIVVHGTEYSYGENGIEEQEPKLRPQCEDEDFEEAVTSIKILGRTKFTKSEVEELVAKLRKDSTWFSYKFNPVEHNCHHFSQMFIKLLCGEKVVLPLEVDEFNKQLLSYRDSWIDEFYEGENLPRNS